MSAANSPAATRGTPAARSADERLLVERAGGDRLERARECRAAALARVPVERELRDDQDAAADVEHRAVHLAGVIREDTKVGDLVDDVREVGGAVARSRAEQNEQATADRPGVARVDGHAAPGRLAERRRAFRPELTGNAALALPGVQPAARMRPSMRSLARVFAVVGSPRRLRQGNRRRVRHQLGLRPERRADCDSPRRRATARSRAATSTRARARARASGSSRRLRQQALHRRPRTARPTTARSTSCATSTATACARSSEISLLHAQVLRATATAATATSAATSSYEGARRRAGACAPGLRSTSARPEFCAAGAASTVRSTACRSARSCCGAWARARSRSSACRSSCSCSCTSSRAIPSITCSAARRPPASARTSSSAWVSTSRCPCSSRVPRPRRRRLARLQCPDPKGKPTGRGAHRRGVAVHARARDRRHARRARPRAAARRDRGGPARHAGSTRAATVDLARRSFGMPIDAAGARAARWCSSSGSAGCRGRPRPASAALVLPAFAVGPHLMAMLARMTRSSMIEVLGEDYVRTARAKGLPEHASCSSPRAAQRAAAGDHGRRPAVRLAARRARSSSRRCSRGPGLGTHAARRDHRAQLPAWCRAACSSSPSSTSSSTCWSTSPTAWPTRGSGAR